MNANRGSAAGRAPTPWAQRWSQVCDWTLRQAAKALGLAFVGVAGGVALQMAYASGADHVRAWTMMAIVSAGLAVIAFGPGLTIGRRKWLAAAVISPVWLAAVGYNGLSALEYFDRYLADAEARQTLGVKIFKGNNKHIDRLEAQRDAIKTTRPVATIESDLNRARRKSDIDRLNAEKAEAEQRDALDQKIWEARTELRPDQARGEVSTSTTLVSVLAWVSDLTGVQVSTASDLRALLLLALTELGAALVPVGMALASGTPVRVSGTRAFGRAPQASAPSGDPLRREANDVLVWLNHRTLRAAGGMASASDLFEDYQGWCTARGVAAVSRTRFGLILTDDCGLAKRKAGAKWTVNYLGVELKPLAPERGSRLNFLAIPGGRAVA